MLHHRTPAKLENPQDKSNRFHATQKISTIVIKGILLMPLAALDGTLPCFCNLKKETSKKKLLLPAISCQPTPLPRFFIEKFIEVAGDRDSRGNGVQHAEYPDAHHQLLQLFHFARSGFMLHNVPEIFKVNSKFLKFITCKTLFLKFRATNSKLLNPKITNFSFM